MEKTNRYALVIGATSGLAYEMAMLLARKKYNLILVSDDSRALTAMSHQLIGEGNHVLTMVKDLFKRENAFALCEEIDEMGFDIDVMVNDAGKTAFYKFEDTDTERELNEINLNVSSFVILTKCFVKRMLSRGSGKILNLASAAGKGAGQWFALSHKTEGFLINYLEAVRRQVLGSKVTLTTLVPHRPHGKFITYVDMIPDPNKHVLAPKNMKNMAAIAREGFEGLMAGEEIVVSGVSPSHVILSRQRNFPYLDGHLGPYEES